MARVERRDEFLASEVSVLKLGIGYVELSVEEEITDKITVSMTRKEEEMEKYFCELEQGVLDVRTEGAQEAVISIDRKNKSVHKEGLEKDILVIRVPVGMRFERLDVDMGAGTALLGNSSTRYGSISINVGAGKFRGNCMEATGDTSINVGAGSVELADLLAKNARLDCGAGSIKVAGAVEGNLNVNCGVGAVEIQLDAVEEDYNYHVNCAIGAVYINGAKRGGLFSSNSTMCYGGAKGSMKLECGVGKIELITRKRLTVG